MISDEIKEAVKNQIAAVEEDDNLGFISILVKEETTQVSAYAKTDHIMTAIHTLIKSVHQRMHPLEYGLACLEIIQHLRSLTDDSVSMIEAMEEAKQNGSLH